ncbi:MAG: hypothetical protein JWM10_4333 [Myxococcaceae bacterium]|nr:hypothetical protein [Myxococcaceae bacterium]
MLPARTLEFVIPVFNEADCLDALLERLLTFRAATPGAEVGFTFVNDGSTDGTWARLVELAGREPSLSLVDLSRNFGHQIAVTAGLDHVDADHVVIIDADLQDPPEVVAEMYRRALEGFDVVYARRNVRRGESAFKRLTAFGFYRLIRRLCGVPIPQDTGDFRLISRKVLRALSSMRERHRFLRGMVPWAGFRSAEVRYDRDARHAGETKYPLGKMVRFALDAIFSFSIAPLRAASLMGVALVTLGAAGGAYVLYLKLFTTRVVPGMTVILLSVILLGGMQIMMLGLIGEYIGRIFEESKRRPLYFINELRGARPARRASSSPEGVP